MGRFVNPDNSAFKSALNARIYVDKSGLISFTNSILSSPDAFICNSRPRRFGKSMTANMLVAYYSKGADSKEIFSSLEISSFPDCEKNLNKYDVIHFDVQSFLELAGGPEKVVPEIKKKILEELRDYYPDCVSKDEDSLLNALAEINVKTGNKFVVIIDEWDVLIRDDANNQKVQDEYISFLRGLFKGPEPSKYIALAYLTGILPIKKQKTQSALNNFNEYTILDAGPFAKYVGFTEDEVKTLSKKYDVNFEKVKKWYDGYLIDDYHIYNPRAVVCVMLSGKFKSYWSDTANYDLVVPLINMNYEGLKSDIIEMISGGEVPVDTGDFQNDVVSFTSKDDVLTYLIHLGYLAYNEKKETAFIPNEEIREEMNRAVKKKAWSESILFMENSQSILEATLTKDGDNVAQGIGKIHDEYASNLKYNDENSLSNVLTLAYLASMNRYFKPIRELPAGRGFTDFVYIPKPEFKEDYPALVVELKWNKDAKTALDQIKEKNYPDSIKDYTDNILLVGINYDKNTKKHECLIEKL
jgi:hypothetical protein